MNKCHIWTNKSDKTNSYTSRYYWWDFAVQREFPYCCILDNLNEYSFNITFDRFTCWINELTTEEIFWPKLVDEIYARFFIEYFKNTDTRYHKYRSYLCKTIQKSVSFVGMKYTVNKKTCFHYCSVVVAYNIMYIFIYKQIINIHMTRPIILFYVFSYSSKILFFISLNKLTPLLLQTARDKITQFWILWHSLTPLINIKQKHHNGLDANG